MARIEIIENGAIWIVRYPHNPTIEMYCEFLDDFRSRVTYGDRIAVIADFTYYNPVGANAELRDQVSAVLRDQIDFFAECVLCEVRVCSSPILRGLLTVFDFVTNLPWPTNNVSTGYLAELWVRSQLARAGIPAPKSEVWQAPQPVQNFA